MIFLVLVASALVLVTAQSPERLQADKIVQAMTVSQKISLLHGVTGPYVGQTPALKVTLGSTTVSIPPFTYEDGPQGVADGTQFATAWPSALTVAATFSIDSFERFGRAMAVEQRAKGVAVLLGPMVNVVRVPVHGRAFESCGEDPLLCAAYGVAVSRGIQSAGVAANIKHLVANNQELNRTTTTAVIDERTFHEVYMKAFYAARDSGVMTAMCSYNRIDVGGIAKHACQHPIVLGAFKANFSGFVMSDWGATHSAGEALLAGLDQEMPYFLFFNSFLLNHTAYYSRIDDAAARILTVMIQLNLINAPLNGTLGVVARSPAHDALARELATNATVLLQNNGVLPVQNTVNLKIAVIGDDCDKTAARFSSGGGSGHVCCDNVTTPLQAVAARTPSTLYFDSSTPLSTIAAAAAAADIAIVCAVSWSSEGEDRKSTRLSAADELMIATVGKANAKSVALIHSTGAVDTSSWDPLVGAILAGFEPGKADGDAFAAILFGDVSPGGRLPVTWASASPLLTVQQYPGINNRAEYSEGLFIGYRWFRANHPAAILFPFGFGLTYTTFALSAFSALRNSNVLTFQFNVTNSGSVAADAVPQIYLDFPAGLGEPDGQLLAFTRLWLAPQQVETVSLTVDIARDITIWNTKTAQFETPPGSYCFNLGQHSFDSAASTCVQL